jgi:hypothetical protein
MRPSLRLLRPDEDRATTGSRCDLRADVLTPHPRAPTRGDRMYIGGGVVALIIIVLLLNLVF